LGDLRVGAARDAQPGASVRLLRTDGIFQSRHPPVCSRAPGSGSGPPMRRCVSSNGLIAQVDSLTAPTPLWALTHRVRWRIYSFLFVFGCIAYFQKLGLTVAADRMMPDLHITQAQLAWLEWALVLGYTAAQFPGGILGRRLGARRAFVLISCFALLGTVLTPLAPELLHGMSLIGVLLALQLVVGLAQGPIFPVSS